MFYYLPLAFQSEFRIHGTVIDLRYFYDSRLDINDMWDIFRERCAFHEVVHDEPVLERFILQRHQSDLMSHLLNFRFYR